MNNTMKHSIKHVLVLLTVLSATMVSAADTAYLATVCKIVAEEEDKLYKVIYQAAKEENVKIQIFDEVDQLVYKENFKSSGFVKKFDLSNLPKGTYEMQVATADELYIETLTLGDVSGFNFILTPWEGKAISVVGSHKDGKDVTLLILDDARNQVYKESFEDTHQVHKKYNFSNLKSGAVTFLLYHDDQLIKEEKFEF